VRTQLARQRPAHHPRQQLGIWMMPPHIDHAPPSLHGCSLPLLSRPYHPPRPRSSNWKWRRHSLPVKSWGRFCSCQRHTRGRRFAHTYLLTRFGGCPGRRRSRDLLPVPAADRFSADSNRRWYVEACSTLCSGRHRVPTGQIRKASADGHRNTETWTRGLGSRH
jgi:hypothetical protein